MTNCIKFAVKISNFAKVYRILTELVLIRVYILKFINKAAIHDLRRMRGYMILPRWRKTNMKENCFKMWRRYISKARGIGDVHVQTMCRPTISYQQLFTPNIVCCFMAVQSGHDVIPLAHFS